MTGKKKLKQIGEIKGEIEVERINEIERTSESAQAKDKERLLVLRTEIDQIDQDLLLLIKERFERAIEIAVIKDNTGLDIYDPDREANILRALGNKLGENESLFEIISVFESILKLSKKAQGKHIQEMHKGGFKG